MALGIGAAIAGAAGSLLGGYFSGKAQDRTNTANKNLSREQMQFQERMSSSAHVRQVADLKAAGLNPILSANTGASAPSGSMATAQAANTEAGIGEAVTTALQAKRLNQEIKNLEATEKKTNSENEFIQKGMPVQEAKGKSGRMVKQGLEAVTSSAKNATNFSKYIPVYGEKKKIQDAVNKQKTKYWKSQAAQDAYKARMRKLKGKK